MSSEDRYTILINPSAEKEMRRLSDQIHKRIVQKILQLEREPRPHASRKLAGHEAYRLRVGDYRIIYTIEDRDKVLKVQSVAHRREIYRDL